MTKKSKVVYIANTSVEYTRLFVNNGYCVSSDKTQKPDLVCFTGGADVNPVLYKETVLPISMIDPDRDRRDIEIFEKWKDVPRVGICRGGQFLNVMSGGAMWQHVNNHAIYESHKLKNLLKIGPLAQFDEVDVTSTHHQMMIASKDAEIIAIATNEDGTRGMSEVYVSGKTERPKPDFDTEVVWYDETRSLCFQPHPELLRASKEHRKYFFALIDYLIWEKN